MGEVQFWFHPFHHVLGYLCAKSNRWRHERWRYRWIGRRRLDGRRTRITCDNKPTEFCQFEPGLFNKMIQKYTVHISKSSTTVLIGVYDESLQPPQAAQL